MKRQITIHCNKKIEELSSIFRSEMTTLYTNSFIPSADEIFDELLFEDEIEKEKFSHKIFYSAYQLKKKIEEIIKADKSFINAIFTLDFFELYFLLDDKQIKDIKTWIIQEQIQNIIKI